MGSALRATAAEPSRQIQAASGPDIVYLRAAPGPGTQVGGAASHINGFINAALRKGARVRLISNDQIAGLDSDKASLRIIGPEPLGTTRAVADINNGLRFTQAAVREIERNPPDFIYQRYSRFNWAGVEASQRTGRPLFLEYNGSEVWASRHWSPVGMRRMLERCERLNLAAAALIFVVSDVIRRNLERAGIPAKKIVVNPNGVDTDVFRPGIGGDQARAALGIPEGATLVGFTGTFAPWHGVLVLAAAIAQLRADPNLWFLLIGGGVLRPEVERLLRHTGAADRAIFTGPVEHKYVPLLLDACDVLVSPHIPMPDGSEFFGSPTKLFEYMAMGKGIVASRLGQIAEVLTDEETALLVEPGDVQALCAAIRRLAASRPLRVRLGAAARESAISQHTWERNADRVFWAYDSWNDRPAE
jgi:glycosyltransferase involved in cell wall biosynthesis